MSRPQITIALCTYNGAQHLRAQLESYVAQDCTDWELWVSDDGSTDGTLDILHDFRREQAGRHDVHLRQGPCLGKPAANYISLLCQPDFPKLPVALSDQDDIWFPNKLNRALKILESQEAPLLYGAQSLYTDADLHVIGSSRIPHRPPSFSNALTQNIVSGHSAALNRAALELVRNAGIPEKIAYHDWWLYQLITAAGGDVSIDTAPVLYYRQHTTNAMGAHQGVRATLERLSQVFGHTYGDWVAANLDALAQSSHLITPSARHMIKIMQETSHSAGLMRWHMLRPLGLHRQTKLTTFAFYLAVILGRV